MAIGQLSLRRASRVMVAITASAGSVMHRNVCSGEVPSLPAASSWSVPSSRSTGTTSRTTNGSETKIVASTIPGVEKMIRTPWSANQLPIQPPLS
jgi:hypothetical protein